MAQDRNSRLQEFVDWAAAHITGDEKGEAQVFLDQLFQAFGQMGFLQQLLDLNLAVAARIERTQYVTAPGIPTDFPEPESLITDDFIRPKD